ncbi:hypothetical protein C8F01DRAFT_637192 [Mycena amicta]|nr:hypothetical protein C8F01DRAFT_637192 [Mycena amicta]
MATSADSASVDWAERVLVSAAVLYFYDFLLTLQGEWRIYATARRRFRRINISFIVLRYIPMFYQSEIAIGMLQNDWTSLTYVPARLCQ